MIFMFARVMKRKMKIFFRNFFLNFFIFFKLHYILIIFPLNNLNQTAQEIKN